MKLWELTEAVEAICPIHGVNSEGHVHFKDEATTEEQVAALTLIDEHLEEIEGAHAAL